MEPNLLIIGTARNARELAEKALRCSPEIYLVDYDLLYNNEPHFSQPLINQVEKARIIMLTDHWEKSLIRRIMAAGVMGCLPKTCDANELVFAIRQVIDGKHYFSDYSKDETKMNRA